jgi:hypothetical protein
MKKFLLAVLVLFNLVSFGQLPTNASFQSNIVLTNTTKTVTGLTGTVPYWSFTGNNLNNYYFSLCENPESNMYGGPYGDENVGINVYDANFNLVANNYGYGYSCNSIKSSLFWSCPTNGIYFVSLEYANGYNNASLSYDINLSYYSFSKLPATTPTITSFSANPATTNNYLNINGSGLNNITSLLYQSIDGNVYNMSYTNYNIYLKTFIECDYKTNTPISITGGFGMKTTGNLNITNLKPVVTSLSTTNTWFNSNLSINGNSFGCLSGVSYLNKSGSISALTYTNNTTYLSTTVPDDFASGNAFTLTGNFGIVKTPNLIAKYQIPTVTGFSSNPVRYSDNFNINANGLFNVTGLQYQTSVSGVKNLTFGNHTNYYGEKIDLSATMPDDYISNTALTLTGGFGAVKTPTIQTIYYIPTLIGFNTNPAIRNSLINITGSGFNNVKSVKYVTSVGGVALATNFTIVGGNTLRTLINENYLDGSNLTLTGGFGIAITPPLNVYYATPTGVYFSAPLRPNLPPNYSKVSFNLLNRNNIKSISYMTGGSKSTVSFYPFGFYNYDPITNNSLDFTFPFDFQNGTAMTVTGGFGSLVSNVIKITPTILTVSANPSSVGQLLNLSGYYINYLYSYRYQTLSGGTGFGSMNSSSSNYSGFGSFIIPKDFKSGTSLTFGNPAFTISSPIINTTTTSQTVTINTIKNVTFNGINQNRTVSGNSFYSVVNNLYYPVTYSQNSNNLQINYSILSNPSNIATISGSVITVSKAGTITVVGFQAGNANFNPATGYQVFNVVNSSYPLTVTALNAEKVYGQSNPIFTSSVVGLVNGNTLDISYYLKGNQIIPSVTGASLIYYNLTTIAGTLTITPADQTISLDFIDNVTLNGINKNITISGTASSGLAPITYSIATNPQNIATISGSVITVSNVGTVTVSGFQAGNVNFNASPIATKVFSVSTLVGTVASPVAQTITLNPISNVTLSGSNQTVTISGSASSGLAVSYNIASNPSGIASLSGNVITLSNLGNVTVTGTQAGNSTYLAASPINRIFTVSTLVGTVTSPLAQTITLNPISNVTLSGANQTVTISSSASSGLAVSYNIASNPSGIASLSGNVITLSNVGNVTVTGTQAGNSTYLAASPVNRIFTVSTLAGTVTSPLAQTITLNPISNVTLSGANQTVTISSSASSGLAVSYNIASNPSGIASLSGNVITLSNVGNVTVTGTQAGNNA